MIISWPRMAATACLTAGLLGISAPVLAQTALPSTARPVVTSFRVSPAKLAAAGGKVTLTAVIRHARKCTFGSVPRLPGLPATVSCSAGRASRVIRVPANRSAGPASHKFTLAVTGPGGKASGKPVTVVVSEPAPGVAGFAAVPADLPSAGGSTVLVAKVERSAKCVLSASSPVAGLPKTFACVAGVSPRRVKLPVSLPALTGNSAAAYTFMLKVTGPGGISRAVTTGRVWPAMRFSAPLPVDAPGGRLGPISCVKATFCLGVDVAGGYALRWNGKSWSAPVRFEQGPYPDAGYLISLSCASVTFCVAGDASGNAFTYNGTTWSAPVNAGLSITSLSCATATFCVAVSASQASVYDGHTWSAPAVVSGQDPLVSVSCPSASFCLAVTSGGHSFSYTGAGWGTSTPFDTASSDVSQVSCATASLCVAIDLNGFAVVYTGTWAAPVRLSSHDMDSVSCAPGSAFCIAFSNGVYYTYHGSGWSVATYLASGTPAEVSCASSTSCLAFNGLHLYVLSGTTWTISASPDSPAHGFTYSISCPQPTFCLAVDWTGAYVTYNGSSWSTPATIAPTAGLVDSVSCTSPKFCMATDVTSVQDGQVFGGHIYIYNGSTWSDLGPFGDNLSSVSCSSPSFCVVLGHVGDGSVYSLTWNGTKVSWPPTLVDSGAGVSPAPTIGYVSCASSRFCAAVDAGGNALTYNGTTWSAPATIDAGTISPLDAISCPTATFCTAVDGWGQAFTYNGNTWSGPAGLESGGDLQAISCTTSRFCAVVDLSGNVLTYNGATWAGPTYIDTQAHTGYGFTGVSCPNAASCTAVDWEGNAIKGTG